MDTPKITAPKVQSFIAKNLKTDLADLILKGSPFPDIDIKTIADQIAGKRKAEKKLPSWFASDKIVYSKLLNLSQSSSETTAAHKASLVSGETLIDITGGFGVDDFCFSKPMGKVVHIEQEPGLSKIAQHNLKVLGVQNVEFITGNGIDYLENLSKKADWLYADPGRRSDSGSRVSRLEDCQPNILKYLDLLLGKAEHVLLKTSPLLDIKQGTRQLKSVKKIQVIAIKNEVKELLWILGDKPPAEIPIETLNFGAKTTQLYTGSIEHEKTAKVTYSVPLDYLYEPNAALLKAGFFKKPCMDYGLFKLAKNSHLYTAEQAMDFQGRRFKIKQILPVHKRAIARSGLKKANVSVRNFPMEADRIRKKFNLEEGGADYLIFTQTAQGDKIAIWCRRLI